MKHALTLLRLAVGGLLLAAVLFALASAPGLLDDRASTVPARTQGAGQ